MKEKIVISRTDEQEENKDNYPHFTFPAQYLRNYEYIIFRGVTGAEYKVSSEYLDSLSRIFLVYFQENSRSHMTVSDALINRFKTAA